MIILDEENKDLIIPSNIGNIEGYQKGYEDGYNAGYEKATVETELNILNSNNNK